MLMMRVFYGISSKFQIPYSKLKTWFEIESQDIRFEDEDEDLIF